MAKFLNQYAEPHRLLLEYNFTRRKELKIQPINIRAEIDGLFLKIYLSLNLAPIVSITRGKEKN